MIKIVALAGGVGGAKLAHGLSLLEVSLSVIVNTGDDFEHLGLCISPDVDTVLYTLAGIANREHGWGVGNETWTFMDQLGRLGAPTWFQLGDRDLALHVIRTAALRTGRSLTDVITDLSKNLGVGARILPMSNDSVRTMVLTSDGELPFQDYFVRLRCDIEVEDFRFAGIEHARPTREVENAMLDPGLTGILICPSNPFVSINPILSVPGMREQITKVSGPVVAVSPIIGGQAVKGPAAKMMAERDLEVSAVGVARCYQGLVSGFVIDEIDSHLSSQIESLGMFVHVTDTIMRDDSGRRRLAKECVMFMQRLGGRGP